MSIRVIHVGVGGRGAWPVRLIAKREDLKSVALVDVNEDNLAKAREASGLGKEACFRSMTEALKAVESDAVIVITPPDMHAGQCLEAVLAGKHVMVEKPFTKSLKEAHQIVSEARQRGLKVAVCQNARYAPQFLTINKLVRERTYGAPSFGLITKYGWRPRTHHSGRDQHSYLWERGVHDFDTARFMFDARPGRVWCHSFNPSWSPYKGGAGIHAWVEFDNGVTCGFLCTFGAHAGGSSLRIEFEGGTLQQVGDDLHIQKPGQQQAETIPLVQTADAETILLNGFLKDIQEGVEPEFSGRQNLVTVGLVECLGAASDRGAVLDFDEYMQQTLGARA
jgi:predicted dehydrogenase